MKNVFRKLSAAMTGVLLLTTAVLPSFACTAVYVGKDASTDGTIIVGRSNDYPDVWANYVTVTEAVTGQPGRVMPVDNDATVFAPIPADTYKYTSTPWMDSATAYNGLQSDAAACANEYGVTMTMSISAFTRQEALDADPEPANGLTEFTADDLVICQSKTAREAVEVLCGLVDTYGSSESNIAIIADQNEAWCVEMYTGHQYAAVKLPSDMVAVFGNEYNLEYLSDYEDCIVSAGLESLAAENGFAVYGENGELNLLRTYAIDPINYSHMRTWIGHKLLAPAQYGDYDLNEVYPLCFKPEEKVSLQDAMEMLRNRFEGTEYSPDETGRPDMRVIGTDTALSVHVLQICPELPAEMACVTWESSGPALYGVFVPVSNLSTAVAPGYAGNQSAEELGNFDIENYAYYAFKGLNTLCMSDVRVYGAPVRAYWHEAEANMIAGMAQVLAEAASMEDSEAAKAMVTEYCVSVQQQAFTDAKQLYNDVLWYMSKNCNTMKSGRNPETHEASEDIRQYDPLEVKLDAAAYMQTVMKH